jgi:hypothetical protein
MKKKRKRKNLLKLINPQWLKKQLLEEGKTLGDVAKKFGVTEEWIRQIKEKYKINLKKRKPSWYFRRWEIPAWATKEWLLEEKRKGNLGIRKLAKKLRISPRLFPFYLRKLKLNPQDFWLKAKIVKINCSWCGKVLKRKAFKVSKGKKAFCNKKHQGFWLAYNFSPLVKKKKTKGG